MPDKWAQLHRQASQPDRFQQQHLLLKARLSPLLLKELLLAKDSHSAGGMIEQMEPELLTQLVLAHSLSGPETSTYMRFGKSLSLRD
jgi:hypothetical protein